MKKLMLSLALCGLLLVPTMGASTAQLQSGPRDLTEHDAALADVQAKATVWSDAVAASDTAREAYDAALAALQAALGEEATARQDYESSQQAFSDAYDSVPKEDTLAP